MAQQDLGLSMQSPVFLLLSERSGSNLLRTLLSNHSRLSGPVAPHLFNTFFERAKHYGDLHDSNACIALLQDMIGLANLEIYNWKLDTGAQALYETWKPVSLAECVHTLYSHQSRKEGAETYVCKENDLFVYAPYLFQLGIKPRFIYLHRDPRDYLASIRKHPEFGLTDYAAINKWVHEQKNCLSLKETHGCDVHVISYEAMVSETEKTMTEALHFLGLPVEPACFATRPEKNEALSWNPLWKNLAKDVMKDNFGGFKDQLDSNTIAMVETIAGSLMNKLGYPLVTAGNWQKPIFFKQRQRRQRKQLTMQQVVTRDDMYAARDAFIKRLPVVTRSQ